GLHRDDRPRGRRAGTLAGAPAARRDDRPAVLTMPAKLTLYVCHINDGGPRPHACRRAHEALREAGHDYETVVFGRGHRFGLFTKGRRPHLKEMSGQEKLPVLQWPDGTTIAGSGNIVAWAKANPPGRVAPAADEPPAEAPPEEPLALVEFPADDAKRALGFWQGLLDVTLESRDAGEGSGWQSRSTNPPVGIHARGRGPGDSFSL